MKDEFLHDGISQCPATSSGNRRSNGVSYGSGWELRYPEWNQASLTHSLRLGCEICQNTNDITCKPHYKNYSFIFGRYLEDIIAYSYMEVGIVSLSISIDRLDDFFELSKNSNIERLNPSCAAWRNSDCFQRR